MDADGDLDLVTANFGSGDDASVIKNNGAGSFGAAATVAAGSPSPIAVDLANIDAQVGASTDLDVVVANFQAAGAGFITRLLNDGSGGLGFPLSISTDGNGARALKLRDLDGDGDPEAIVANQSDNEVAVLPGDAFGSFAPAVTDGLGSGAFTPLDLEVADFNDDDRLDVATANFVSDDVSILLGDGAGGLATGVRVNAGVANPALGPSGVASGDLNGDGKPDLVSANFSKNNISVLRNDAPPDTTIASGPQGTVADATPSFSFDSDEPGVGFRCSIDGAAASACGRNFDAPTLSDGAHQLAVVAVDADGNVDPTPATRSFTVQEPPETTITKQPKDKTSKAKAKFAFSSSEAGSSFECKLDKGGFKPCDPSEVFKVKKGKHKLEVRATDAAGNTDPTPAQDAWKVKKKKK